jgi:hypothetical protein
MKEIEACPCGSHVEVASVHNCKWGSWSMNLPTLWSMEKAVTQYSGRWDVYINLSGDTLPVYTQDRMAELFAGPLKGINFVTSVVCETGLRPTPVTAFRKGVTIPTVRHTIWTTLMMMVSNIIMSTSQPILEVNGCR